MNNKIFSIRADSATLDQIKTYAEIEKISQTDLINELLTNGLDYYRLQRAGGAVFTLPNPQIFNGYDDIEKAKEALVILRKAAEAISELNLAYPIPLYGLIAYYDQRLVYEIPENIKQFKFNMMIDQGTQCEIR